MFYIYILKSIKFPRTYVGFSSSPTKRLSEHNKGLVKSTKHYKPWVILYKEEFFNKKEAQKRELYYKNGAGRKKLKKIINGFPPRPHIGGARLASPERRGGKSR